MVIAFIPVRGGSKSIPLKNIKLFCGKPLVYWNILALQLTNSVDKIVVATDSDEIKKVVSKFNFTKVELYDRKPENAVDSASTESVMLEYIEASELSETDVFMLVQATSPLTEEKHFSEALNLYKEKKYDSLLSCVRNKRFFWSNDGVSINYDYKNRPRRQEFSGMLMENGAFYINTVLNIKENKNRLSGCIGIYVMPEYTATEIDELDDWIILEDLMKQHILSRQKKDYSKVKLVISDVDGVLTDSGMYYSEYGDELKKFNTRDGMALQLFRERGIKTAIITSESTILVERRAKKLNVDFLMQGKKNIGKLDAAKQICEKTGIPLSQVAFVGDDINDIELLKSVGFCFCPADAVNDVKKIYGIHILASKGGEGAVREVAKIILG